MSDAELLARITLRPEQCGGRPCIRGMRIRVTDVLGLLAAGAGEPVIFAAASAGGAAVVVTKDDDSVRLLDQHGPPPQVVWVTCGNVRNPELRRIMLAAWPQVAALLAAGEPLVEVSRQAPA